MQLRFSLTFSNTFLTALVVLLTWASLAQAAAINRDILPAKRDPGAETRAAEPDISLPVRNVIVSRNPEDETFAGRDMEGPDGWFDDWYTVAARNTGESGETLVDGDGHPVRRWYTLVEIPEAEESE